jgi:hypothetical protein
MGEDVCWKTEKASLVQSEFAAVSKGHGSSHSCGSAFSKRCWNIFDRNAVVEPFRTDIGFRLDLNHKHNLPSHLDHGRAREVTRPLWVC